MFPTIIFFFALTCSVEWLMSVVLVVRANKQIVSRTRMSGEIMSAIFLWSWLFHLLH